MGTILVPTGSGFVTLPPRNGSAQTAFISKPGISNEYALGELTKFTGVCHYQLLSAAGVVRGALIHSPKVHTVATSVMLKIGQCPGPFEVNHNLQQLGLLIYESPDSSVLIIPVDVRSPLLVEVDV